jgi:hypothetical protein
MLSDRKDVVLRDRGAADNITLLATPLKNHTRVDFSGAGLWRIERDFRSFNGPKPTSNHPRRCCGAARQTGLSLQPRNMMLGEFTVCGLSYRSANAG